MDHTNILLLLIVALNCLLAALRLGATEKAQSQGRKYTYIDQDFPIEAPLGHLSTVEMTFQESVRFSSTSNESDRNVDWHIYDGRAPDEWVYGHVWLGDLKRLFVPAVNHQLHCLRFITEILANLDDDSGAQAILQYGHIEHCLNYFRQTLLCRADNFLEQGDFMYRDFDVDRIGDTRVCNDWTKVFSWLDGENAKYMPLYF